MSTVPITMLWHADKLNMAKDTVHKLEIQEGGAYLLLHEEHYQALSLKQKNSDVSDELLFLSQLGEEIFSVGFVIKFFREKKNWKLRRLGSEAKISYSQISLYENDKVEPEPTSIDKLTTVLGPSFNSAIKLAIKIKNRNSQKSA